MMFSVIKMTPASVKSYLTHRLLVVWLSSLLGQLTFSHYFLLADVLCRTGHLLLKHDRTASQVELSSPLPGSWPLSNLLQWLRSRDHGKAFFVPRFVPLILTSLASPIHYDLIAPHHCNELVLSCKHIICR